MPGPALGLQPTREEIIAYITKVAAEKGIDPATFIQVLQGESGLNPAAEGDFDKKTGKPQSRGIAQYYDKGLGPDFTAATGYETGDPQSWKAQIDFMADKVTRGGGWKPWHAAANQGIGQFEGLPGGKRGQVVGRRGRAGEVGQTTAMAQPQGQHAPSPDGRDAWLQQWQDYYDPKQAGTTLLGKGMAAAGWLDPNLRQSQQPKNLGAFLARKVGLSETPEADPRYLTGPAKELAKAKDVGDLVNTAAPMSAKDQIAQKQKKRPGTLGQLAITKMFGAPEDPMNTAPKSSSLLGLFGWG